ncbi:MAG TPA: hypothetical protein VK699_14605 [Terriglobales bacterium]|nr:hypothetical protein [Terriglobales bacterium]
MPRDLKIDPRLKLVFSIYYGELEDSDLSEQRFQISNHPDFRPDFSYILDFTGVTKLKVSTAAVRDCATSPSLFVRDAVRVMVAPAEAVFGLSRMYQMLAEETRPNLQIVRTLEEAYRILGISGDRTVV